MLEISAERLAAASAVLSELQHSDLEGDLSNQPELKELRRVGKEATRMYCGGHVMVSHCNAVQALFQRLIIQERFGERDVVEYLQVVW